MNTTTKRITLATIKSFVRKNRANLRISTISAFDGMEDGVRQCEDQGFLPALESDVPRGNRDNTMGIRGAWFVLNSRDDFYPYSLHGLVGYTVSNCCGMFCIAVPEDKLVK
jgi:hypothetical protein